MQMIEKYFFFASFFSQPSNKKKVCWGNWRKKIKNRVGEKLKIKINNKTLPMRRDSCICFFLFEPNHTHTHATPQHSIYFLIYFFPSFHFWLWREGKVCFFFWFQFSFRVLFFLVFLTMDLERTVSQKVLVEEQSFALFSVAIIEPRSFFLMDFKSIKKCIKKREVPVDKRKLPQEIGVATNHSKIG